VLRPLPLPELEPDAEVSRPNCDGVGDVLPFELVIEWLCNVVLDEALVVNRGLVDDGLSVELVEWVVLAVVVAVVITVVILLGDDVDSRGVVSAELSIWRLTTSHGTRKHT
jgi:hypothetical protein